MKAMKSSDRTWIVEGETNDYYVWFEEDKDEDIIFKCTCPYYTRHKGRVQCKHIKLVLESLRSTKFLKFEYSTITRNL